MNSDLLESLKNAKWDIMLRTYGSSHSTLIGLLVLWWITGNHSERYVLEPGFTFGYHSRNRGGGICDAVLVERDIAKGIVEVEGSRHTETLKKIGNFFVSHAPQYKTLEFGIFLAYQTEILGQGEDRNLVPFPVEKFVELGKSITAKGANKKLAILLLEKKYERLKSGLRARSKYYMGSVFRLSGILVCNGKEIDRRCLLEFIKKENK